MPDGDRIYNNPGRKRLYQAYDMLLERQPLSNIAFQVQSEIAALIRKYGNESRELIDQSTEIITQAACDVTNGAEYQLDVLSSQITEAAEHILGHRRGLPLAVDACKAQLFDVITGHSVDDIRRTIVEEYVWRIYDADFAERLPLYFHDPRTNMEQGELNILLHGLRQEMQQHVEKLTGSFTRVEDIKNLHRSSRDNRDFNNDDDDMINTGTF
jgi:hypothetical protein